MLSFLNAHILPQVEGGKWQIITALDFSGAAAKWRGKLALENRAAEVCTLLVKKTVELTIIYVNFISVNL